MRRARGAHDVVDARGVDSRVRRTRASPRRAGGSSSCGPARAARALRPACRRATIVAALPAATIAVAADVYASLMMRAPRCCPPPSPKRLAGSAIVLPTSPKRGWTHHLRRHRSRLRRSRGRARPARASATATSSALVLPPGPEYLLAYSRRGEARRDHRGRERPAVGTRARRRARHRGPEARDRRRPPARRHSTSVLAEFRATSGPARRAAELADDPDRPVAIIFTSGTTGMPKGALYCNRQLAFITQTDVGDTWGGGGRSLHRHVVRAPRLHDQAARQPAARRHELHHDALARAPTRSSCSNASR